MIYDLICCRPAQVLLIKLWWVLYHGKFRLLFFPTGERYSKLLEIAFRIPNFFLFNWFSLRCSLDIFTSDWDILNPYHSAWTEKTRGTQYKPKAFFEGYYTTASTKDTIIRSCIVSVWKKNFFLRGKWFYSHGN